MLFKLQQYYQQTFPDQVNPVVSNLARINEGWESDVYSFQVEWGLPDARITRACILRIYPGQDAYEKSVNEHLSLSFLRKAGYPVPEVYSLERDHSPFGQPFLIMEKVQGRSMWPLIFNNPDPQDARRNLDLFSRMFVRLHRLDWRPYVPDPLAFEPGTPYGILDRQLARIRPYVEQFQLPGMIAGYQWLEDNKGSAAGTTASLIHWDFHPNNILARFPEVPGQEPAVVIDWTGLEISDYRLDLAWTLLLVLSYQGQAGRDAVFESYEKHAGQPVEALPYFEVMAAIRRLFSIVISVRAGAEALGMRPGAENIMREQREPIARIYALLHKHSGLVLPEVEELLSQS